MGYDLWPRPYRPMAFAGRVMRLNDDIRKCVGFISGGAGDDFKAFGTGFHINYKSVIYFVTARHVVDPMGDDPFVIRFNGIGGEPHDIGYDSTKQGVPPWHFHPDETVDLAIVQGRNWRGDGIDMLTIPEDMLASPEVIESENIGVGDACYAVGLFRLMSGKNRILPIVHTGNIAMLPQDERIPVKNWKLSAGEPPSVEFEGYLVEMNSLEGLSGSPVFVRSTILIEDFPTLDGKTKKVIVPRWKVFLLGVWRSAWTGDPSAVVAADRTGFKVPVGMGAIEPTSRLLELLESSPVVSERNATLEKRKLADASSPD